MDEKDEIKSTDIEEQIPGDESNAARKLRILGDKAIQKAPETTLSRLEEKKKKAPLLAEEERLTQRDDVIGASLDESNAAKRVRILTPEDFAEKDEAPIKMGAREKITNFWYHHKWKVIIGTFFAVVLGICLGQLLAKTTPDIAVMYVGPQYISASDNESIGGALKSVISDYNGDGKKGVQFSEIIYLNEAQIKAKEDAAHARGEYFVFDAAANSSNYEQFTYEVMTGETVVFFLDPDVYENMIDMGMGIFLPLDEVFDEVPDSAIDGYAIRLGDIEAYEYFTALRKLPSDTVICIRDVRTMSFYKGEKKMTDAYDRHVAMMRDLIGFKCPND